MPTAIWNNKIIAEASENEVIVLEGNVYFPPQNVDQNYLKHSDKQTVCHWKGTANYFDIVVDEQTNANAGWTYPEPKDATKKIAGYIAFWRGVQIVA